MAAARGSGEDVNYDTDESGAQLPSNKKFKAAYKQRFRIACLELPQFRSWLEAPQGGSKPHAQFVQQQYLVQNQALRDMQKVLGMLQQPEHRSHSEVTVIVLFLNNSLDPTRC